MKITTPADMIEMPERIERLADQEEVPSIILKKFAVTDKGDHLASAKTNETNPRAS